MSKSEILMRLAEAMNEYEEYRDTGWLTDAINDILEESDCYKRNSIDEGWVKD